jgi:hypothetical protein
MNKNESIIGTIAGTVAGAAYFAMGESGVPKESNATYLNPVSTDIAAWVFGAVLVWKGFKYNDGGISFIGSTVISIHVSQFAAHKVIKNRIA